jgi:transcriptional regulator GlxA family with amidase domain
MKVSIVTFEDFTDLDLFLPWDLLNRVRLVGGREDWEVKILGTEETHTSMSGLKIPVSGMVDEVSEADAVVFTSGRGVSNLLNDVDYLNRLKIDPERQLIGAMCSGALLLGALGLLKGVKATTYPTKFKQLAEYGAIVVDESFVKNGNIATAANCLAAKDLAAWMIQTLSGDEMVKKVMNSVEPLGSRAEVLCAKREIKNFSRS